MQVFLKKIKSVKLDPETLSLLEMVTSKRKLTEAEKPTLRLFFITIKYY